MKKIIFIIAIFSLVLITTGCDLFETKTEETEIKLSDEYLGYYEFRGSMYDGRILTRFVIILENDTAKKKMFYPNTPEGNKKVEELDFTGATVYDVKVNSESKFDLYLNDEKEYECSAHFGYMDCNTKNGKSLTYNRAD